MFSSENISLFNSFWIFCFLIIRRIPCFHISSLLEQRNTRMRRIASERPQTSWLFTTLTQNNSLFLHLSRCEIPTRAITPASRHRPSLNQSNRLDFFEADHNLNTDPNWGRVKRRMNEIHKSFESLRCHQDENCPLCCCPYLSVEIICPHLYLS